MDLREEYLFKETKIFEKNNEKTTPGDILAAFGFFGFLIFLLLM